MIEDKNDGLQQIYRLNDVVKITGLSRSTIYDKIKKGTFPNQIRLGGDGTRAVGWLGRDLQCWQNSCIENRTPQ